MIRKKNPRKASGIPRTRARVLPEARLAMGVERWVVRAGIRSEVYIFGLMMREVVSFWSR